MRIFAIKKKTNNYYSYGRNKKKLQNYSYL